MESPHFNPKGEFMKTEKIVKQVKILGFIIMMTPLFSQALKAEDPSHTSVNFQSDPYIVQEGVYTDIIVTVSNPLDTDLTFNCDKSGTAVGETGRNYDL